MVYEIIPVSLGSIQCDPFISQLEATNNLCKVHVSTIPKRAPAELPGGCFFFSPGFSDTQLDDSISLLGKWLFHQTSINNLLCVFSLQVFSNTQLEDGLPGRTFDWLIGMVR